MIKLIPTHTYYWGYSFDDIGFDEAHTHTGPFSDFKDCDIDAMERFIDICTNDFEASNGQSFEMPVTFYRYYIDDNDNPVEVFQISDRLEYTHQSDPNAEHRTWSRL